MEVPFFICRQSPITRDENSGSVQTGLDNLCQQLIKKDLPSNMDQCQRLAEENAIPASHIDSLEHQVTTAQAQQARNLEALLGADLKLTPRIKTGGKECLA